MRAILLAAITAAGLVAVQSQAKAETGPCQESDLTLKVGCLNVRLGNDETSIANLQAARATAQTALDTANKALKAAAAAQDIANSAIPNGSYILLKSTYSALKKCLAQPNFDAVNAQNCDDRLQWRVDLKRRQ